MSRNLPILLGVVVVALSAAVSVWFFFFRDASTVVEDTSPEGAEAAPSPTSFEPFDFSEENLVPQTVVFESGAFSRDSVQIDTDGKIFVLTLQNNTEDGLILEFEEKAEDAPMLEGFQVAPHSTGNINFIFPGEYVIAEQNSGARITVSVR